MIICLKDLSFIQHKEDFEIVSLDITVDYKLSTPKPRLLSVCV